LTGEVTRDGGRLGGLDGGREPAEGVPAGLPHGEPCGVVLLLLLPLEELSICRFLFILEGAPVIS